VSVALNCPDEETVRMPSETLASWGKALVEQRGPKFQALALRHSARGVVAGIEGSGVADSAWVEVGAESAMKQGSLPRV
jgi:hypothetical protein